MVLSKLEGNLILEQLFLGLHRKEAKWQDLSLGQTNKQTKIPKTDQNNPKFMQSCVWIKLTEPNHCYI